MKKKNKRKQRNLPQPPPPAVIPNNRIQRKGSVEIQTAAFAGLVPPPELLKEYNEIVPNAAERIFAMAENQSAHRMALEKRVINGDDIRAYLGLGTAFVIAMFGLYLAYLVIMAGHGWPGAVLGTADLASLVSVFIYGTRARRQERQRRDEKNRALTRQR